MDEERRELERSASLGDASAAAKLRVLNDRVGLSHDDADYLLAYLDLCNRAVADIRERSSYEAELVELNKAYVGKVGSKTLRETIATLAAFDAGYDEVGWSSSRSC